MREENRSPRLFGHFPWSRLAAGEDLPGGVALERARWCRNRDYLLGDRTLPLGRYDDFTAPTLAYSIDDDWLEEVTGAD